MERNKFEEHIKQQLRRREIAPSTEAWERLSKGLDNSEKPGKKGYFRYGIAASFIGLLIISVLYFNFRNSPAMPNVNIVDTPKDSNTQKEADVTAISKESIVIEKSVAVDATKKTPKKEVGVLASSQVESTKVRTVAINRVEHENSADIKNGLPIKPEYNPEKILKAKILEVVAQVNFLEKENIDLTDAEVDSLLWQAQMEITANNKLQNGEEVDPTALLTDVEDQLDRSFRDKLFDRLKTGFVKVRTAVADSDN